MTGFSTPLTSRKENLIALAAVRQCSSSWSRGMAWHGFTGRLLFRVEMAKIEVKEHHTTTRDYTKVFLSILILSWRGLEQVVQGRCIEVS